MELGVLRKRKKIGAYRHILTQAPTIDIALMTNSTGEDAISRTQPGRHNDIGRNETKITRPINPIVTSGDNPGPSDVSCVPTKESTTFAILCTNRVNALVCIRENMRFANRWARFASLKVTPNIFSLPTTDVFATKPATDRGIYIIILDDVLDFDIRELAYAM